MLENLRRAFREAVDNFKEELTRDNVPEAVDRLLRGMANEVTDAKALLKKLEADADLAEKKAAHEKAQAATCRRREEMASKIGDEETARVAAEYAERHEERQSVMEQKATAMRKEIRMREAEITDMLEKYQQANKNRDVLAAQAGRVTAQNSIRGADDLFSELDRMADKISGTESQAAAAEEVSSDLHFEELIDEDEFDRELRVDKVDFDARLDELKRRMGED